MMHWKAIGGAVFLTAAALGSIGSVVVGPAASVFAVSAATAARASGFVEIGGSLLAGLVASLLTRRRA